MFLNTKKTAIYPNYQLDESHQTKNTLSESKSTTPRTSSRTLIVDQNTNLGIELFENKKRIKIRCNLQAYRREKSRINIVFFISKSSYYYPNTPLIGGIEGLNQRRFGVNSAPKLPE